MPAVTRLLRHALMVILVVVTASDTLAAVPAQAQGEPPTQPGVTLRVFDLGGVRLSEICTLRSGQTPNVDKHMPTIDYATEADFGLSDFFVSHTVADLIVPTDGEYRFRLFSDDGSRLSIDGEVVVLHDGPRGIDPPGEGSATLTAGSHELFLEHFEASGGQQVTLQWQPPGATGFEVVPSANLATPADVVRVTSPGTKYCEGATDTAGDGLRLDAPHPNYDLIDLRPDDFEPMVAALAWTADDRLLVATAGEVSPGGPVENPETGELFVLDGVLGDTSPEQVTVTKLADGLHNPMGVLEVDGTIYLSERDGLTALRPDANGDGLLEQEQVAAWPYGGNFHEFAFGLLYEDGHFYVNLSVAINQGGKTTDPQPAADRGTTIRVNPETGEVDFVAGGLRTPNGMGWGPDGELFVMDNQGDWLPSSQLLHVTEGAFFNHRTNPPGPFDDQPVTRPVLWLPQGTIGNSPSNPVMLEEGPFAGQMVFGDVTYGGLQRGFIEQVDGAYQGAAFRHSAGFEAGINRTILGPDGALYVGGIGESGNWNESGKLDYGLQKLLPNGTNAFDIHEMRATPTGFELSYTQPLSAETIASIADAYQVQQWTYSPAPTYGGPRLGEEDLQVASATVSPDGMTVTLDIPGLQTNRVVHVRSPRPFASASGEQLWNTEAWYTLNEIPGDEVDRTWYEAEAGMLDGGARIASDHPAYSGTGFVASLDERHAGTRFTVEVPEDGAYDLGLRYANGPNPFAGDKTMSLVIDGGPAQQVVFPSTIQWPIWATQRERVHLTAGAHLIELEVGPTDTGEINLDAMSVRPAGERITLLGADGDLSEWQHTDGRIPQWPEVEEGVVEVVGGDLRTIEAFGDYTLHVEFWLPELPPEVTGQQRANSGVYQQERYEIQVLDSFGIEPMQPNDAAAIYLQKAADVNAATAPETWQTYDIDYTAARYDAAGDKVADARVSVRWNDVLVHDDVAITGPTGGNLPEGPATGAIRLQDHNDPGDNVRYRNIWIEPEYDAIPELTATATPTSGIVPLEVAFDATAVDPEGTDVTVRWDFGDGSAPVEATSTSHTYDVPGRYRASVTATDEAGRTAGRTFPIEADPDCSDVIGPDDEFDGTHLDRCRWTEILREDGDHLRVVDGTLQIDALEGDMQGGDTSAANVVLQDLPAGQDTWQAVTHLELPEGDTYEQGGLIVHEDDQHFAKLMLMDVPNLGWVVEFGQTLDGQPVFDAGVDRSPVLPAGINDDGIWLRITSDGIGLTAAWSADGQAWTPVGRTRPLADMPAPRVGLAAYNGLGQPGSFDFFHLEDGPAPSCTTPVQPDEGYRMLFDGTAASLDEWVMAGPGGFALQQDCSLLSHGGLGLLYHPDALESYRLRLDWKLAGDDNGGVFVGFPDPGTDPWIAVQQGHEIQIDATDDADSTTGAVYNFQAADVAARDAALNPPGQWNEYELVVTGDRIQVLLNGVEINDFTDTDPARMNAPSHIGIQNHGGGDEVHYRNIQVTDIPTPEGPAPTLDVTAPEADTTVVGDTVTVSGTTDGIEVEVRAGTALARTIPTDGAFSVDVPVTTGSVELAVTAVAADGSTTVVHRTIAVSPDHGTLVGALTDPVGDDDGPGTYVYPTNEVFEDGVFDLTGMEVHADGDDRTFVIGIDGPVTNPSSWNGDQIAMQRVNVYIGDGSEGVQAALPGTNMDTESAWQAVVVIDGRYDAAGVYGPDGTMIAEGEIVSDPANHEFGVVVPASAFGDLDLATATYGTAMFVNAEGGEGIGNVRPVYDLEYWQNPGPGMGYITEWRLGGGAGVFDNTPAHDTDLRDANALDIIVGEGQAQSTVLDWTLASPTQLPMVPLPVVPDPLTIDVSVDPAEPDGAAGWYTSPVTVTAVASDPAATVELDVDGAGFVADDDGVVVVDADGVHTVTARAVLADEVSPVESVDVSLDATAPTVTIEGVADGDTLPSDTDVQATWSVTDAVSGVDTVDVVLDDSAVTADAVAVSDLAPGQHVLTVSGVDGAGNAGQVEVSFVVEAPDTLTIAVSLDPTEPDGAAGWYTSPVTVTAVASDAAATVEFDVDGGGFVADDDGVLVIDTDGVHTVTAQAVDGDRVSPEEVVEVRLDATAPTVEVHGVTDGEFVPQRSGRVMTWSVADDTSGPGPAAVVLDRAVVDDDAIEVSSLRPGRHVLTVSGVDLAGHPAETEITFHVVPSTPGPGDPGPPSQPGPDPDPEPGPQPGRPDRTVNRTAGANRFATAAALSEEWEPGVERVFLAPGSGFADALAAVPIAGANQWPILLVEADRIPEETAAALQRLQPRAVTVLGGTAAIGDPVVEAVVDLTGVEADRVAGASRFDTAAELAARFVDGADVVFVATGDGFADSLAIGAAAVAEGGPLLLTMADELPSSTVAQLERLSPQRIVVVGGEAVITPAVVTALGDLAPEVVRWAGADRYGTSAAIVREAFPGLHQTIWMATGEDYPDALVGGVSAGMDGAPLVAVQPDCVPEVVLTEVERMSPDVVMVLGGPATVGNGAAGLTSCAAAPGGE